MAHAGVTPAGLLVVSVLTGIVYAIDTPARLAFVIDMVGRDDLMNAVALNSLVFNIARAVGPALGGLLLPRVDPAGCFLFNALTFAGVLGALLAMRLPPIDRPRDATKVSSSTGETFRYLAGRRGLLLLLLMAGALAFFGWPMLSLLPAVSDRRLEAGTAGYSSMLSAIGAGALVGALFVASFGTQGRRAMLLALGVLFGVAALVGLASTQRLSVAVAWCFASGCGLILFFATGQATMQLGADEHNRGRVMGVWLAVLSGAQPAGNLVFGYLADVWGVRQVLLFDAAGIAVTAVVVSALALGWWRPASSG
jgi:predicted MFS family arabinose efflux permease